LRPSPAVAGRPWTPGRSRAPSPRGASPTAAGTNRGSSSSTATAPSSTGATTSSTKPHWSTTSRDCPPAERRGAQVRDRCGSATQQCGGEDEHREAGGQRERRAAVVGGGLVGPVDDVLERGDGVQAGCGGEGAVLPRLGAGAQDEEADHCGNDGGDDERGGEPEPGG